MLIDFTPQQVALARDLLGKEITALLKSYKARGRFELSPAASLKTSERLRDVQAISRLLWEAQNAAPVRAMVAGDIMTFMHPAALWGVSEGYAAKCARTLAEYSCDICGGATGHRADCELLNHETGKEA